MEILWLLFIIIAVISGVKKKEQQEAQKKAQAARTGQAPRQPGQAPQQRPLPTMPRSQRFPEDFAPAPAQPPRFAQEGRSTAPPQRTAAGTGGRMTVPTATGNADRGLKARVAASQGTTLEHMLGPSRQSGHAHMETSMEGFSACPPGQPPARSAGKPAAQPAQPTAAKPLPQGIGAGLCFDRNSLVNGLLYAEILGKPKALRRG